MKNIRKICFGILIGIMVFIPQQVHAKVEDDTNNGVIVREVFSNLNEYEGLKASLYDIYIYDVKKLNDLQAFNNQPNYTLGEIQYNNKAIYVAANSKIRKDNAYTLYHEIGHAIDGTDEFDNQNYKVKGKYSLTDEFKDIFEKEKRDIYLYSDERFFLSDVSEYFAECYAIYKTNPDALHRLAPLTYNYIEKIVNQKYTDNTYLDPYLHQYQEIMQKYCTTTKVPQN